MDAEGFVINAIEIADELRKLQVDEAWIHAARRS
jgi:hypothetical protein